MPNEAHRSHDLVKTFLKFCERPQAPLSIKEQRRRYRRRHRLPDWAWGVVVGLLVSAAVVTALCLVQK